MNIAFLVEGTTELRLYPKWINYFSKTPLLECTTGYQDVVANQFTIFNVEGIGRMKKGIQAAIMDIRRNPVFDYLVVVVDADDNNITASTLWIQDILSDSDTLPLPVHCQLKIIVQQVCIETWFIGHSDYFLLAKSCGDKGIRQSMSEYDALNQDPALMPNQRASTVHSIGAYHADFLRKMLNGANRNWRYSKTTAHLLIDIPYLQRLEQRLVETPTHLQSFSDMILFLKGL
jgi:hypothetical protein